MKNYLLTVLEQCSEEKFGQDAVEWAIFAGHITLTYDLKTDLRAIMGCGSNYDRIIIAYRRATAEHGEALVELYHASGLMAEILRPIGRLPRPNLVEVEV